MALARLPFLGAVALSPFFMRKRIDRLGSRAREMLGELNAFSVDTIQGLSEIAAFQREGDRGRAFIEQVERHHRIRLPFFRELTIQTAFLEAATGLGGLVVIVVGVILVNDGALDRAMLPMLSLLAMAAFLPISEIANVGRQLADTLGATRRLYAVENEVVPVTDGPGVPAPAGGGASLELENVGFSYFGGNRQALSGVSMMVPAGGTVAGPMKGPWPLKEFWPLQPVKRARQTRTAISRVSAMTRMASFSAKSTRNRSTSRMGPKSTPRMGPNMCLM